MSGLAPAKSRSFRPSPLRLVDSGGVVYAGRPTGLNSYKRRFAVETKDRTLADAVRGADVFIGLSTRDILTPEMLGSMANRPVVFALANADPEIRYELALETRTDVVLATGRSDYPNQVNNALGFPSIFRGALDVRATTINRAMELAAARALAALAKEPVPGGLLTSHGLPDLSFGPRYLIPSVFDPRVVLRIAPAVAAMTGGVARRPIEDPDRYGSALAERMATRWPHVRLTQPGARVR